METPASSSDERADAREAESIRRIFGASCPAAPHWGTEICGKVNAWEPVFTWLPRVP